MSSTRICVVTAFIPPMHSGAGLSAFKYAFRLHKKGQLESLITRTKHELSKQQCIDILGEFDKSFISKIILTSTQLCKTESLLLKSFFYPVDFVLMWMKIFSVLQRQRKNYDILHCFSPTWFSFFSILTGKILGKKVLLEITRLDGDDPVYVASYDRFKLFYQRRNLQYKLADAITCNSPALLYRCYKYPVLKPKSFLIPRAYNQSQFNPSYNKTKYKNKLSIEKNQPILLFVGGIIPRKGVHVAIEVLNNIKTFAPRALLLIVGPNGKSNADKKYKQELEKMIDCYSLKNKVHFIGYISNVYEYMMASDFFIFPSENEGLPNVVIEAMACGNIPLINNIPNISDYLIKHETTGYIIKNNNPSEYAIVINELMNNSEKFSSISKNASNMAQERFSSSAIDKLYFDVYLKITGQ